MLVIDVQGFNTSEGFTPKGLAIYDGTSVSHYIFKQPYSFSNMKPVFQKQATWLMKNHHCIDWHEGFTPLYLFPKIIQRLTQTSETIYVKGREKTIYIRRFVSQPVMDVQEQPALTRMPPSCFYHSATECFCALYTLYQNYVMH